MVTLKLSSCKKSTLISILFNFYFSGALVFEILIWVQHSKREVAFRLKREKILIDTYSGHEKNRSLYQRISFDEGSLA